MFLEICAIVVYDLYDQSPIVVGAEATTQTAYIRWYVLPFWVPEHVVDYFIDSLFIVSRKNSTWIHIMTPQRWHHNPPSSRSVWLLHARIQLQALHPHAGPGCFWQKNVRHLKGKTPWSL